MSDQPSVSETLKSAAAAPLASGVMTTDGILGEFRTVLKEKLELEPTGVMADTPLGSLGADSLMLIELMMELEDRFGVEIKESEAKQFLTVGDVVRHVQSRAVV